MKNKIVECVPNFSEGRDDSIIQAIADAIRNVPGVTLLDVDPGKSTNRTVYSFVGSPEGVIEAALASAAKAYELIDMSVHEGEHPRMGAMDVCPFVPVSNVTMDECVEISKIFAKRASEELGLPMYLYEFSQDKEYRKKLPQIRKGEYEALPEKLKDPKWKPDFGPDKFNSRWGATVTGARNFLIAFNVNILGTYNQAHRIALNLREAGRGPNEPGRFKELKGLGWYVDEYNTAQCSFNLNNYHVTAIHEVFEATKEEAAKINVAAAGSEIVGLIPLEAMLMAADYYIEKENLFILDEDQKINLVIDRLGLNSITQFIPEERIIDYIVKEDPEEPISGLSVKEFIKAVDARTSAPGGGSVSAAVAALGVALQNMVAKLTYGVRKFEQHDAVLRQNIPAIQKTVRALIPMIDADTAAFTGYMEALRLPKNTDEEKRIRHEAMQNGLKDAVMIPLKTMRIANSVWKEAEEIAKVGNMASASDVTVGARCIEAGIWGAWQNVLINLKNIEDKEFCSKIKAEADSIKDNAKVESDKLLAIIEQRAKSE
ncbi:MAG: glutamate formimidoyltransferase [Candidatus Riflebacteria bacterium]|nr:glutamate formimidoyltransferase [Candidatus Riflebacteria bacterium]